MTRLKVLLPQDNVALAVPLKFTVPPLAVKVEPLLTVNVEAKLAVPLGAVKLAPELSAKALVRLNVVYEPKL